MRGTNPFKPSAGARPPLLVGREHALDSFVEGLEDGPGAPGLLTRVTGQRGTGKTVLLSEAEDRARERGWAVVSETATPGLLARITAALQPHLDELGQKAPGRRISGIGAAGISIAMELPPRAETQLRDSATRLATLLLQHGTGLLITIDEIHSVDRHELSQLGAVVQHLIREDLPIALVFAGIPQAVSELLNDDVSTFLRRADPIELADVPLPEVASAFVETYRDTGLELPEEFALQAAAATSGYPFLIQLVGYHSWRLAHAEGTVTEESLTRGIEAARRRLGATVLEPAVADLSGVDRTFLLRMAEGDGPATLTEIAKRMGQTTRYASNYRKRLLAAGVVRVVSTPEHHGQLDFFLPELRQYLREHIASSVDVAR